MREQVPKLRSVEAQELLEYAARAKRVGLSRDPRIAAQQRFLQANPNDSELRDIYLEQIEEVEVLEVTDPNPFRATNPISPLELPGDIGIGHVEGSGLSWLLPSRLLREHLLVAGRSGGGKTSLILLILCQILERRRS